MVGLWLARDQDPRLGYEVRQSLNTERLGYVRTASPGAHYDWEAWCDTTLTSFVCGRIGIGHGNRLSAARRLLEHHMAKHR